MKSILLGEEASHVDSIEEEDSRISQLWLPYSQLAYILKIIFIFCISLDEEGNPRQRN